MKPADTDYNVIESDYSIKDSLHNKKLDLVLQRIDPCQCLLDVGCGTGELIARLKADGKCEKIYGIDSSEEAYKICVDRFRGDENIVIMNTSIEEVARRYPSRFDHVLFLDVIEHNDGEAITQILKAAGTLLKPDGNIIVTTPGIMDKLTIFINRIRGRPYKHLTGHSSYGWLSVLRSAGYKIIVHRTIMFPIINADLLNRYAHLFGKCHMIVARK